MLKRLLEYNLINRGLRLNNRNMVLYSKRINTEDMIRSKYDIYYSLENIEGLKKKSKEEDMERTYNEDDVKNYSQNFDLKLKLNENWRFEW